jgi:hypothetical protein
MELTLTQPSPGNMLEPDSMKPLILLHVLLLTAVAGPVEFGRSELERAFSARGLKPAAIDITLTPGVPESYSITPTRISGGDERGLMYGLLEAAGQVRATGRVAYAKAAPANNIRGIRYFIHNRDLEEDWYYSREYWTSYFAMLARNRFNRFNLVFAHSTAYLAPPYPFWFDVPRFPEVKAHGTTAAEQHRNLAMLRFISDTAAAHGVDFTVGIWQQIARSHQISSVDGLTHANLGPYCYAALKKLLAECPNIRTVQMRINPESGISKEDQLAFYRDYVFRAIREAGRTFDLRAWAIASTMAKVAREMGLPLRVSAKYWAEHMGRPYQPAETYRLYSYQDFLEKPRDYPFFWEVWGLGSHRLLVWGDPAYVRRAVSTFGMSGTSGFEIDPPLAQKGFGNRPGKYGIFTESQRERVFWQHEFERYWYFYSVWGRLGYDPSTPDAALQHEFRARFGSAAGSVAGAYKASAEILTEIVAASMPDPNMFYWPEINSGGLIDAYVEAPPSDFRFIANVREAVRDRLGGSASAKQTPLETAARLDAMADRTEDAVRRANASAGTSKEWSSSEPDFQVLALLARYHARKQTAAWHLAWFDETGDPAALADAKSELTRGLAIWERLVKLTDGLYPSGMAFATADVGHWKDKLPYVRHDLELVREREEIVERFGRFEMAFDFGGPVKKADGASFRNDPFILGHTVAPRFRPVDPDTVYDEKRGYGWAAPGVRSATSIQYTPFQEIRGAVSNPRNLPRDVLFRDFISGSGSQAFKVRLPPGDYSVVFLNPDRTTRTENLRAADGTLSIVFPNKEWSTCGLVIQRAGWVAPPFVSRAIPARLPRPRIIHTPPAVVEAGKPVTLQVRVDPPASVSRIRLHYRTVNHSAAFTTVDAHGGEASFTIPASVVSPAWDLMYYFEIMAADGTGWFYPDPLVTTPYYVVETDVTRHSSLKAR